MVKYLYCFERPLAVLYCSLLTVVVATGSLVLVAVSEFPAVPEPRAVDVDIFTSS